MQQNRDFYELDERETAAVLTGLVLGRRAATTN